jgi:hypothetical protein
MVEIVPGTAHSQRKMPLGAHIVTGVIIKMREESTFL